MAGPRASRPFMPGYGIASAGEGSGLLPWGWAEQRLASSHHYWLVTVWPDGRPHSMPVWAVWHDGAIWLSSGGRSRKVRNLAAEPRCTVTTSSTTQPVVLDGIAQIVTSEPELATFLARVNDKYGSDYGRELVDPAVNATVRIAPRRVIALDQEDFPGSPTRWTFPAT